MFQSNTNTLHSVLTLINSGASDHYFVNKSLFILYILYNSSKIGLFTDKGSTFNISGKGPVQFLIEVNRIKQKIIFNNVLHTPSLCPNLISISKLISKGVHVKFAGEGTIITTLENYPIMSAVCFGQLYIVNMLNSSLSGLTVQSK